MNEMSFQLSNNPYSDALYPGYKEINVIQDYLSSKKKKELNDIAIDILATCISDMREFSCCDLSTINPDLFKTIMFVLNDLLYNIPRELKRSRGEALKGYISEFIAFSSNLKDLLKDEKLDHYSTYIATTISYKDKFLKKMSYEQKCGVDS